MQDVHLGRTASGKFGYFTGHYLAWDLTKEQHDMPTEWHVEKCKHLHRFNFVPAEPTTPTLHIVKG